MTPEKHDENEPNIRDDQPQPTATLRDHLYCHRHHRQFSVFDKLHDGSDVVSPAIKQNHCQSASRVPFSARMSEEFNTPPQKNHMLWYGMDSLNVRCTFIDKW